MQPDWVSNPGPLSLGSDVLTTALRGPSMVPFKDNYGNYIR